VPLSFAPGEGYQFDWSYGIVVLGSVTATVKVAHVRLCHSRRMFVRAYTRETQELFDTHERASALFRGARTRGIYDNMKTAVETIFLGRDRQYNRRVQQTCAHHLVDPVACTPASGDCKGAIRVTTPKKGGMREWGGQAILAPGRRNEKNLRSDSRRSIVPPLA
jgi:transposase